MTQSQRKPEETTMDQTKTETETEEQVHKEFLRKYEKEFFSSKGDEADEVMRGMCIALKKEHTFAIFKEASEAHDYYNPLLEVPLEEFSKEELLLIIDVLHGAIDAITNICEGEEPYMDSEVFKE